MINHAIEDMIWGQAKIDYRLPFQNVRIDILSHAPILTQA